MGLFSNNQLLSNIQWNTQDKSILVWRFPDADQVLQNNSTVIVGPGQAMIFVNEGKAQGVITEQGTYDLKTGSIPFFSSMMAVFRGGDTKHKASVFFVNMTEITDVKWGTKSPLKYNDPVYKFPVGLRAFGNYSFKITKPAEFFTEYSGMIQDALTLDQFQSVITDRIITPISDALASAKFGYTDIDSNRDELSAVITEKVAPDFDRIGFSLTVFRIENTDFDDATQALVGSIASTQAQVFQANTLAGMNTQGLENLQKLGQLEALKTAAANPNGLAGAGVGLGAGLGMGAAMVNGMNQQTQQPQAPVQPVVPPTPAPVEPMMPSQPEQPVNPTQSE